MDFVKSFLLVFEALSEYNKFPQFQILNSHIKTTGSISEKPKKINVSQPLLFYNNISIKFISEIKCNSKANKTEQSNFNRNIYLEIKLNKSRMFYNLKEFYLPSLSIFKCSFFSLFIDHRFCTDSASQEENNTPLITNKAHYINYN